MERNGLPVAVLAFQTDVIGWNGPDRSQRLWRKSEMTFAVSLERGVRMSLQTLVECEFGSKGLTDAK